MYGATGGTRPKPPRNAAARHDSNKVIKRLLGFIFTVKKPERHFFEFKAEDSALREQDLICK